MRRARLTINRSQLPLVRILWPLEAKIAQDPRYSIYDLLNDVNIVFPLDGSNRGLEEYVVEHQGCELVHFMPIGELIGDGDEITIRPLTTTETREYLKGGRTQISETGRKLLDGVPFGRNLITPAPDRPQIDLEEPPAKRVRLSITEDEEALEVPAVGSSVTKISRRSQTRSSPKAKTVHFGNEESSIVNTSTALVLADMDDEDDEESDDDFNPDALDEDDDTSSEESDDDQLEDSTEKVAKVAVSHSLEEKSDTSESSNSESDSDSSSSSSSDGSDAESLEDSDFSGSSDSSSDSSEQDSDSDSDSSSSSDSDSSESESVPEELSSKASKRTASATITKSSPLPKSLPFQGARATQSRNQRRRETRSLLKLIRQQILPVGATKEDLRRYRQENGNVVDTAKLEKEPVPESIDAVAEKQIDNPPIEKSPSPAYTPMEPLEVLVEEVYISQDQSETPSRTTTTAEKTSPVSSAGRRRPVASDAAKRLIFGSLGLRKPRNQEEDEKLRSDFKKANSKYVGNKAKGFLDSMAGKEGMHSRFDEDGNAVAQDEPVAVERDPDVWKSQIQISAVECDEDYYDSYGDQLPAPSFPFNQNQLWKNYNSAASSNKKGKSKKNKRKRDEETSHDSQNWDASYYDESSMHLDSAQASLDVMNGSLHEDEIDDLPPVPPNLLDYPELKLPVHPKSIVVFKKLGLDKNYTPTYQQLTARVLSVDGEIVKVQLAKRDCPEVKYDEETGERIFGQFHMPGMEDDDIMDGIEEISYEHMLEGRVIKEGDEVAQESVAVSDEHESERVPETVHEDNIDVHDHSQIDSPSENQDMPMVAVDEGLGGLAPTGSGEEELSRLSGVVAESSSFFDPPFQTNGSCGYGHSDTSNDSDRDIEMGDDTGQGDKEPFDSIPSHQLDRSKYSTSGELNNIAPGDVLESSAEVHRYDDPPTQEADPRVVLNKTTADNSSSQPFNTAPENSSTPKQRESFVQVPSTPDPHRDSPSGADSSTDNHWDLSLDISAFEPAEAEKIKQMVKIKDECPEDTEILREALKPFHHPSEITAGDGNISVDISPPGSPVIKRERFSTQEALESPIAALQDITERSTNGNGIGTILESQSDDESDNATGSGSGFLGNTESPPAIVKDVEFISSTQNGEKSDRSFQQRRRTDVPSRRSSNGRGHEKEQRGQKKKVNDNVNDDFDFDIPSSMPVKSLTSGKTAFSGRIDAFSNTGTKKKPELITIDSDEEFVPPAPRASLEIIGGDDAPTKPGAPKMKRMLIKRRHIPKRSESIDPEASQSQWMPSSSQQ